MIDIIKKIEKAKEYISWKKNHKKAYLANFFKVENEEFWQVGYYNPESDLITVFLVGKDVKKGEESEVFKQEKKLVKTLKIEDVKIDDKKALEEAKKILDENYKGSTVFKTFMILQNLEKIGQVWNVTFVTEQFKTVNVKINSKNGSCISHKLVSLIQGKEE